MEDKIGAYSFIAGVVIAIVSGVLVGFPGLLGSEIIAWFPLILVILGIIVGLLNVNDKEIDNFLLAAIALLVVGNAGLGVIPMGIGPVLQQIVISIGAFVAPAALIVALKEVSTLASKN